MPPTSDDERPHRKLLITVAVLGTLALTLAVAAAFGGLRAQSNNPATGGPGVAFDQGLFKVQVIEAHTERADVGVVSKKKTNVLVVLMHVTVKDKKSWDVGSFLQGMMAEPKPGSYVAADIGLTAGQVAGDPTLKIHPRIPLNVRAVWPLPGTASPRTVTIALRKWTYTHGFTNAEYYWYAGKQSSYAAKVTVPVRPGGPS